MPASDYSSSEGTYFRRVPWAGYCQSGLRPRLQAVVSAVRPCLHRQSTPTNQPQKFLVLPDRVGTIALLFGHFSHKRGNGIIQR